MEHKFPRTLLPTLLSTDDKLNAIKCKGLWLGAWSNRKNQSCGRFAGLE